MAELTLGQAIRNAIEAERAASRFYSLLANSTQDQEAKAFLTEMADQEIDHVHALERLGANLPEDQLPLHPDRDVEAVETAPAWEYEDDLTMPDAMKLALEAEQHAALYYSAMSDFFPGEAGEFFEKMCALEEEHARRVSQMREKY